MVAFAVICSYGVLAWGKRGGESMMYLLPGMGASQAMYQGAWRTLPGLTCLDWPAYRGEASLSAMADRLIRAYGITSNDAIGGSSLGGMVALEIHKKLKNRHVVLLGSALAVHEIRPALRRLAPFVATMPIRLMQWLTRGCDSAVIEMFRNADAAFLKTMCGAALRWDGYDGDRRDIMRIHGARDRVIPCPQDAAIVADAGHLVAMTHPDACVQILAPMLRAAAT